MIVIEEAMFLQVAREIIGRGIKVELRNRPQGAMFAQTRGARVEVIMPRTWRQVGTDEKRENKVTVLGVEQLQEEYVCTREAAISMRFESDSGIRADLRAQCIAEDFRNALRRVEWRDRLRACGFAVSTLSDVIDVEYTVDTRAFDVSIFDVMINASYSYTIADVDFFTVVNDANEVKRDPSIPTIDQPSNSGGWRS